MASKRALICSTARTGLAKSFRSGFNATHGAAMTGEVIRAAIERAGIAPGDVEDVHIGCGNPEAATGHNIARNAALWAGCPATTSGVTVSRFCSSGLNAIATAAYSIADGAPICVAGGVESISMVMPSVMKTTVLESKLKKEWPALWMPMIETADIVGQRYGISREAQDAYALESQRRTAAAQDAGKYDAEIVPVNATMEVTTPSIISSFRHHCQRYCENERAGATLRPEPARSRGVVWRVQD